MTDELVVAGYLVVRPEKLTGGFLPQTDALVSASACLIDQLPEDDHWFATAAEAGTALTEPGARVLTVLVTSGRAARLAAEIRESQVYEPVLLPTLESPRPLADGGTVLGWEVVGYDLGNLHTWLCRDLHRDAVAELGVRTGPEGLLPSQADAEQVAAWAIARGDTEPVVWFAAALVGWPVEG
ncbi:hypothetical protein ACIA8O_35955 [Kitasatospora sp. NPDC051853]|uniref:hypothetical protein n=1 Tax=Kitasatospora sp. NPDC051853 TaxID=3364058 RepID=UPI0037BB7F5D